MAAVIIAAFWAVRIVTRNRDWRDNVAFYTATLAISPDAYYIHNNLGTEYWEQVTIRRPQTNGTPRYAWRPRASTLCTTSAWWPSRKRHYRQAEILFLRALAIRPNYSDAHLDLGENLRSHGQAQEAEAQLRAAENLSPLSVRAHNTLSEFYLDRRRLEESEAEARRSVEIEPTPQGYWDLGLAEWLKGDRAAPSTLFWTRRR